MELEYCHSCDEATGRAGVADDSIFCEGCGCGPLCDGCSLSTEDGHFCKDCIRAEIAALKDEKRSWEGAAEIGMHKWYRGITEQRDVLVTENTTLRAKVAALKEAARDHLENSTYSSVLNLRAVIDEAREK